MSTRSTIAHVQLNNEKGLHIFYDVDGVHITLEKDRYDYEHDIHITDKQWKTLEKEIVDNYKVMNSNLNSV